MESYLTRTGTYNVALNVPQAFDAETLARSLAELLTLGTITLTMDEATLRIVAPHVTDAAQAKALVNGTSSPEMALRYQWLLPPETLAAIVNPNWRNEAVAFARGLPIPSKNVTLSAAWMSASDEELLALCRALAAGAVSLSLESGEGAPAAPVVARMVALADESTLLGIWASADTLAGTHALAHYASDAQLDVLLGAADPFGQRGGILRFELLRRGRLDAQVLERAIADIAALPPHIHEKLPRLFKLPVPGYGHANGWAPADRVRAIAECHRHIVPLRDRVLSWHAATRAQPAGAVEADALFVLALAGDADAFEWTAARLNEWAKSYKHSLGQIGANVGEALVGRSDAEDLIQRFGKALKGKTLSAVAAGASSRLESARAEAGLGAVTIRWANTDGEAALRVVKTAEDPFALLEAGIGSSDPVAQLNAFEVAYRFSCEAPERRLPAPDTLAFMLRGVRALEKSYLTTTPDLSKLGKLIGGSQRASQRFDTVVKGYLHWQDWIRLDAPDARAAARDELVELFLASKSPVFRGWAEPLVKMFAPEKLERTEVRLPALAAASLAELGDVETVTRSFVFRTDARASKTTINRLYGPPMLAADRVPTYGGQPMQHVLTLEASALDAEAKASLRADTAAVAVFLSSLQRHEAFQPDTAHAAVVELTEKDVAQGAAEAKGDVVATGLALSVITVKLPAAVFKGGAKKGALFELRRLLDRDEFLATARAPRWLQEPQPAGRFLFDLDESFAREVNLGDSGRLYVFDGTAFIQSS